MDEFEDMEDEMEEENIDDEDDEKVIMNLKYFIEFREGFASRNHNHNQKKI